MNILLRVRYDKNLKLEIHEIIQDILDSLDVEMTKIHSKEHSYTDRT